LFQSEVAFILDVLELLVEFLDLSFSKLVTRSRHFEELLTLGGEMSLNGVKYDFFSLNLLFEGSDLLLKLALLLSVETVIAGLGSLKTAVQVLDVEFGLNIKLVDLLLQSLNVLVSLFTFFGVVVLLLSDVKGELLQFSLEFALLVE
jgi:hypothetical protein